MTNLLGNIGSHPYEAYALLMGTAGISSSIFFFLVKFQIISVNFVIDDVTYLWFFSIFTGISGLIHLLSTIGLIGTGR